MPKPNCKCYICGKPIYKVPSRMSDHPLCSYSCRNKYFSGKRSSNWKGGYKGRRERLKSFQGRENERKRKYERKERAIKLLGGKCSCCGYDRYIGSLDFHHINPEEKDLSIKELIMCSWERIFEEIKKCILVCSNCHREIHWELNNGFRTTEEIIRKISESIRAKRLEND